MNRLERIEELPPGMLLHCGAKRVSRIEVQVISTPSPTESWYPLGHDELISEVESQLTDCGFDIENEGHALSHNGARYFGLLQVRLPDARDRDYSWILGLRNSHDKSYPAGLVAGTRVLVCDNLCFTGEVKISRRHTLHAARDLKNLTARAIGKLGDRFHEIDERISMYKGTALDERKVHDLVVRAVDCRAITPRQLPAVLKEWRKPRFEEFSQRNAWSLFNGFTEVFKGRNPHTIAKRGEALHGLFDSVCASN